MAIKHTKNTGGKLRFRGLCGGCLEPQLAWQKGLLPEAAAMMKILPENECCTFKMVAFWYLAVCIYLHIFTSKTI